MKHKLILTALLGGVLCACAEPQPRSKAVYLLLDTSGTYTAELEKVSSITNYLLGTLDSGDSIAVAKIDNGSFSEKDVIAHVTFDERPSVTNEQKRAFKDLMDEFIESTTRGSTHTDISGGLLQATEFLNETQAGQKYALIFSDLEEDLVEGHVRDFRIELGGINVVALNVTKLRSDNIDPRDYMNRVDAWQSRVEEGGGQWRVINDLDRLDRLVSR